MEPFEDKSGSSRLESWPVRDPYQVLDVGRGSAPKDTLRGATQRISSTKGMEIFAHTESDLRPAVYGFTPLIVDENEDIRNISPPGSIGSNISSSTTDTTMTNMSIFDDLFPTGTSPWPNLAIRD